MVHSGASVVATGSWNVIVVLAGGVLTCPPGTRTINSWSRVYVESGGRVSERCLGSYSIIFYNTPSVLVGGGASLATCDVSRASSTVEGCQCAAGNSIILNNLPASNSRAPTTAPPPTIAPTSMSPSPGPTFAVDDTAPVPRNITFLTTVVIVGAVLDFSLLDLGVQVYITDGNSGFAGGEIRWTLRSGAYCAVTLSATPAAGGSSRAGWFSASSGRSVSRFAQVQTASLSYIMLRDTAGNTMYYRDNTLSGLGFNVSALALQLFSSGGQADSGHPIPTSIFFNSNRVWLGGNSNFPLQRLGIRIQVTDDTSGFAWGEMRWTLSTGVYCAVTFTGNTILSGNRTNGWFPVSSGRSISRYTPVQVAPLTYLVLRDIAGNSRYYRAAQLTEMGFNMTDLALHISRGTASPTVGPTDTPSSLPPSSTPTSRPTSASPTIMPSERPTVQPTLRPTFAPTDTPSQRTPTPTAAPAGQTCSTCVLGSGPCVHVLTDHVCFQWLPGTRQCPSSSMPCTEASTTTPQMTSSATPTLAPSTPMPTSAAPTHPCSGPFQGGCDSQSTHCYMASATTTGCACRDGYSRVSATLCALPTSPPSSTPTSRPTSASPTIMPSERPTVQPTLRPTFAPTDTPSQRTPTPTAAPAGQTCSTCVLGSGPCVHVLTDHVCFQWLPGTRQCPSSSMPCTEASTTTPQMTSSATPTLAPSTPMPTSAAPTHPCSGPFQGGCDSQSTHCYMASATTTGCACRDGYSRVSATVCNSLQTPAPTILSTAAPSPAARSSVSEGDNGGDGQLSFLIVLVVVVLVLIVIANLVVCRRRFNSLDASRGEAAFTNPVYESAIPNSQPQESADLRPSNDYLHVKGFETSTDNPYAELDENQNYTMYNSSSGKPPTEYVLAKEKGASVPTYDTVDPSISDFDEDTEFTA